MHAAVRAALRQILSGLEFDLSKARGQPVALQLHHKESHLLPASIGIFLNLVDHRVDCSQRRQLALEYRSLLEFLACLMSAPFTQWNAYFNELWDPELMQRFGENFSLIADQRLIVESNCLPSFVLRMGSINLSKNDFDLCYEFLTSPSAQVLSVEQQTLLGRVNGGINPTQLVIELGLQLSNCTPSKEVLNWLRDLLERLETSDRNDPIKYPVHFKIATLWFGMNSFAMPCNMDVLMDLSSFTGVCPQSSLSALLYPRNRDTFSPLDAFPSRVLLDSSVRNINLSELKQTGQHIRRICSTLRATDHIQEVSFEQGGSTIDGLTQNEYWAWIAFGILHRDSRSTLKRFNFGCVEGSIESMEIMSRILASPHPGTELVMAIAPKLKRVIRSQAVPLPEGKRLYISMKAKTNLFEKPSGRSSTVFSAMRSAITEEMQWEVLVKLSNGWTCILVPAYGVSWVSTDSIVVEHEMPSAIHLGDKTKSPAKGLGWVAHSHEDVQRLLPMIGHSFESLQVYSDDGLDDCMTSILDNCPNLKYLDLVRNESASPQLILKAFEQGRSKLESLILDLYSPEKCRIMSEMALLLSDPSARALRHLILYIECGGIDLVDDVVASCRFNRTLEVLKVVTINLSEIQHQQVKAKLDVLNGELLAICISSSLKLAFLSVVERQRTAEDHQGMGRFDSLIISRIFQYAGSSVRRKIVVDEL